MSALFPGDSFGQSAIPEVLNPANPNSAGIRVSNVTVSSSYFSQSFPSASFSQSFPSASGSGFPSLGSSSTSATMLEAGASFGWSKRGEKSTFSVTYSPSFVRQFQISNYHSFNQSLGVSATRRLSSKLTMAASFQGLMSDFNQLLFAPTQFGSLSGISASFDELVSGLLTGQSSNTGLSQILALAPVNGSPQTAFLYGGRILSTAASVSLGYAQSTRSTFSASMQVSHTQFSNAGSSGSTLGPAALIPVSNMAGATIGWSYAVTPRTTASVNLSSSRSLSRFADAYATAIAASIGRTLSTRWFVDAFFGAGFVKPVHQMFATSPGPAPDFGGTVAYKFKAQTLLGSYTQTISDSYGLGASSTRSSTGGWTWSPTGSSISVSGGFGYSQLTRPTSPTSLNTTSWTANAGLSKKLSSQLFMNASYSYVQFPEALISQGPNLVVNGVMVGLSWSPSARR